MAAPSDSQPLVVCFGEILWDFLPDALYPGGAPLNIGYHLSRHGCSVHLVSAVGTDALGAELRHRAAAWGLDISGMRRLPNEPTGYVRTIPDDDDEPVRDVARNVAWDGIELNGRSIAAARRAQALVFGSLAQRTSSNQRALERLLDTLPEDALRIFDMNLRPPHIDRPLLRRLAGRSSLLKLNAAEAAYLAGNDDSRAGREERDARTIAGRTGCPSIVVTAGARGSGWLRRGTWYWEPAHKIRVVDTNGASEAFLAALIAGLLPTPEAAPGRLLAAAVRRGEWVARQHGATPAYG